MPQRWQFGDLRTRERAILHIGVPFAKLGLLRLNWDYGSLERWPWNPQNEGGGLEP